MRQTDTPALVSPSYFAGLLGMPVAALAPVYGGRNNRVFGVTVHDGTSYAAKIYSGATAEGRSRVSAEFSSLMFLHQQGVTCVPRPIVADETRGCAVYEFVSGRKVSSSEITESDVDEATRFLLLLSQIKATPAAGRLPPAAEACFSIRAIIDNIEVRSQRLLRRGNGSTQDLALRTYLDQEFLPVFQETCAWCRQRLEADGRAEDSELETADRTLSPSDFGFHNALKQDDGRLVFLDFEYFGWDDPAKMVSDFLLHPAMELRASLKGRFLNGILDGMDPDGRLRTRIVTVYPLFGLKWCLILLNEFLPEGLGRRGFASGQEINKTELQEKQLAKSRQMLQKVRSSHEGFPYWGDGNP